MNEVQTVTRFRYAGKEYDSLSAIRVEIENRLGAIIDASDHTLSPKQKLNIHTAIIGNHAEIAELLTVRVDMDEDSLQGDRRNILSMKF